MMGGEETPEASDVVSKPDTATENDSFADRKIAELESGIKPAGDEDMSTESTEDRPTKEHETIEEEEKPDPAEEHAIKLAAAKAKAKAKALAKMKALKAAKQKAKHKKHPQKTAEPAEDPELKEAMAKVKRSKEDEESVDLTQKPKP